jgi:hypothetical protein
LAVFLLIDNKLATSLFGRKLLIVTIRSLGRELMLVLGIGRPPRSGGQVRPTA